VFARVSTFRVPPNQVEEAIHYIREQVLPGAQQMEGFEGPFLLFDRDSGKALMVGSVGKRGSHACQRRAARRATRREYANHRGKGGECWEIRGRAISGRRREAGRLSVSGAANDYFGVIPL
jgi:hypothetical protein